MRALAMTGMVTASWISTILSGSAMRATPPSARISAGTRSRAITATAPASSAIRAWSAVVTSMITPPLSISARPLFTRIVPISGMTLSLASAQTAEHAVQLVLRWRDRPEEHGVLLLGHDVGDVLAELLRHEMAVARLDVGRLRVVLGERDRHRVAALLREEGPLGRGR